MQNNDFLFILYSKSFVFTPDRDRPVSVTKLMSQISHPNRTLFTVPLILIKSTGLKLTINVSLIASENI